MPFLKETIFYQLTRRVSATLRIRITRNISKRLPDITGVSGNGNRARSQNLLVAYCKNHLALYQILRDHRLMFYLI